MPHNQHKCEWPDPTAPEPLLQPGTPDAPDMSVLCDRRQDLRFEIIGPEVQAAVGGSDHAVSLPEVSKANAKG